MKNLGKKRLDVSKRWQKNVLKSREELWSLMQTVAAYESKCSETAPSTVPDVINFYLTGKGIYLGKLVASLV